MGSSYPIPAPVNDGPSNLRHLYPVPRHRISDESRAVYDAGGPKRAPARASEPYVKAPLSVVTDGSLSPWARLLYLLLLDHRGPRGCIPGRDTLARELDTSERTVDRALAELAEAGRVRRVRRGRGHSNAYELSFDSPPVANQSGESTFDSPPVASPDSPPVANQNGRHLLTEPDPMNQRTTTTTTASRSRLLDVLDGAFPRISADFTALNNTLSATWLRSVLADASDEVGDVAGDRLIDALIAAHNQAEYAFAHQNGRFPINNPMGYVRKLIRDEVRGASE